MAAYAALVSLFNDLELIPNHPTHSFSFDNKQISSLYQIVEFLIDFMETYDPHGCSNREAIEILESQITSAAQGAHDVVESHVINQIHAGSTRVGGKTRTSYFLHDLQKAIEDMEFVKRKAMQFKAKSGSKAEQPTYSAPSTSLKPLRDVMVGFDTVVLRLLDILTGEPSNQRLVIPIVGMGGSGKTSLAKNVFDRLFIEQRFDVRLWATISQEYSIETILTELLFGEGKSNCGGNASDLGEKLRKKLWDRRYLIVLDDMWSLEAWDGIQMYFPHNGNGSRVIVTTRLSNLAAHLSSSPLEMDFLDEDKSWKLFCGKTFGEEEDCPVELEEIGQKIVKRCRGLPLSIVVIAGHLRKSSRTIDYWEKVANFMNPISNLEKEDDQCLKIISSSYEHLPACLKPCFLYMGIFREDEWIDASKVLQFWIAEGFIKPKKGVSLEEVGEDYLKDLIDRNLILVIKRRWNGKAEFCMIHDIVRELCVKVGKKEKFMCVVEDTTTQSIDHNTHRIVIHGGNPFTYVSPSLFNSESAPLLRSLMFQFEPRTSVIDHEFPFDSRLLRVSNITMQQPNFQQVNLRCHSYYWEKSLYASRQSFEDPSSMSLLWNLQTLVIKSFGEQIIAPNEIWEMLQLRHLHIYGICLPDPLPGVGSKQQECILRNLHTVLGVENLRLTEEVCKRMPNIKELDLVYVREASPYYCLYNLDHFKKLESLTCKFDNDYKMCDIVSSLTFPSTLEELCLWNCRLDWKDMTWMIKSLPLLGSLQLHEVLLEGLDWDLVGEEFSRLKELMIYDCPDLIYWNANSSHFPVLENLDIILVPNLSEISLEIGEIPSLRVIKLCDCRASAAVSAMRMVVEQESLGNEDLQLYVVFSNMEEVEIFNKTIQEECLASNSLNLHYKDRRI